MRESLLIGKFDRDLGVGGTFAGQKGQSRSDEEDEEIASVVSRIFVAGGVPSASGSWLEAGISVISGEVRIVVVRERLSAGPASCLCTVCDGGHVCMD